MLFRSMKMEVASAIKSGKLLYYVARDNLWPRLQRIEPKLLNEPFPVAEDSAREIDDEFVHQVLYPLSGNFQKPSRQEADANPEVKALRNRLLRKEEERYMRIVEGRFFEINGGDTQ